MLLYSFYVYFLCQPPLTCNKLCLSRITVYMVHRCVHGAKNSVGYQEGLHICLLASVSTVTGTGGELPPDCASGLPTNYIPFSLRTTTNTKKQQAGESRAVFSQLMVIRKF
jgi:hypothetical protein